MLKQCAKWKQARPIPNSAAQPVSQNACFLRMRSQNASRQPGVRNATVKSVPPLRSPPKPSTKIAAMAKSTQNSAVESVPPWRNPPKPATKIAAIAKSTKNSAAKPVPKNMGLPLRTAVLAHENDKEYLEQTIQEIRAVFRQEIILDKSAEEECLLSHRISWSNCWGKLQAVLSGVYSDLLHGTIHSLTDASRQKLVDIARLLKAKLVKHHEQSVLVSRAFKLVECMEELAKAVVDTASWHMRLDELLCREGGSASYHKAQSDMIETRLDDAQKRLKEIAAMAREIGVGAAIAKTPQHY